jgi:hypothetical protein
MVAIGVGQKNGGSLLLVDIHSVQFLSHAVRVLARIYRDVLIPVPDKVEVYVSDLELSRIYLLCL